MNMLHASNLTSATEIGNLSKITDERLTELLARIRPLVPNPAHDGALWEVEVPSDVRHTAFRWDPTFVRAVEPGDYVELGGITTYHTCGYAALFKPDLAETLAQIPAELIDKVAAVDVLFEGCEILSSDFYGHKTVTVLYGRP